MRDPESQVRRGGWESNPPGFRVSVASSLVREVCREGYGNVKEDRVCLQ
jgi:hypothetical protein